MAEENTQRQLMTQRLAHTLPEENVPNPNPNPNPNWRLASSLSEEINRLQSAIDAEKSAREETEEAMMVMLEDVVTRFGMHESTLTGILTS